MAKTDLWQTILKGKMYFWDGCQETTWRYGGLKGKCACLSTRCDFEVLSQLYLCIKPLIAAFKTAQSAPEIPPCFAQSFNVKCS